MISRSQLCGISTPKGCSARRRLKRDVGAEEKKREGRGVGVEKSERKKKRKINRVKKGDKIYIYFFFFCSSCRRY